MKFIVLILAALILTSPMREHVDVVVVGTYCDNSESFDNIGLDDQHHDDNEDERNSNHHHHCVDMSITNIFTPTKFEFQLDFSPEFKKPIFSYKKFHSFSFLDRLFQPPRV
ncbi:hypothetical protein [Flavivirga spongiicola]|uniref:Uncharacterized protein n=1 Tax=Flavivirga spongiicola TaxID=421621 RepID=A0ABU7XR37_9FLAO|nr:hypothetical protein [Flavivirga sp. MEBiC05379]MDO5978222.1 hypothetical protein [Flavivirga sp. MEBiC05379]